MSALPLSLLVADDDDEEEEADEQEPLLSDLSSDTVEFLAAASVEFVSLGLSTSEVAEATVSIDSIDCLLALTEDDDDDDTPAG